MDYKSFIAGFGAALIVSTGLSVWLYHQIEMANEHLILPEKRFTFLPDQGVIIFNGSIGGREKMANPDNIYQGYCEKAAGTCETQDVQRIGVNQIGSINSDTYRITKWTPNLIVAESAGDYPVCVDIKLNIRPKEETIEYVRSPKSPVPDSELCRALERRTMVWTIEDPPSSLKGKAK